MAALQSPSRVAALLGAALGAAACSEADGAPSAPAPADPSARASEPAARVAATKDHSSGAGDPARAVDAERRAAPDAPRVYAKSRFVWIRLAPSIENGGWIGFMWLGGSVPLKETTPRYGPGCGTWYAIEPRGFVCVDGDQATLDPKDPALLALAPFAPNVSSPWPHEYAESRGARRYETLPTPDQQKRREYLLDEHLARVEKARAGDVHPAIATVDVGLVEPREVNLPVLPRGVRENRRWMNPLSTIAWSTQTSAHGRSWLLTADYLWVPKDRVTPYPKVTFRGVELGKDASLPLAFFRGQDRPRYERDPRGDFVARGTPYRRLSWIGLTGERAEADGAQFAETKDGSWIAVADAVIPEVAPQTPWGTPTTKEPETTPASLTRKPGKTWLDASVWKGWLIAYEDTRPVFVTLISPGRGGVPEPGKDPLSTASTPTGTFKITGKFATATMEAPGEFIHSDVPWAQNFSGPHALHGAYWHDDWGNRKSAGCVNVSPIDGKWLYEFTEPRVPEGWHGVRWSPQLEPATTFVIHP